MPIDPTKIIGEILGHPASEMRRPAKSNFQCPFIDSQCLKRSQKLDGAYPVCSVWRGQTSPRLVCLCPKRFFQVNFLDDVIKHCWTGSRPANPHIAHEVQMAGFGQVDFVIADLDSENGEVREFISVELQAVDITGSVEPAYQSIISRKKLQERPSHGFNWANVRKRYISQLISKGFYHHHWGTRMVAVLQSVVYDEFRKYIEFDELLPSQGNIVFMLYDYADGEKDDKGRHQLKLTRVVATSHNSLMMGALYRTPPPKDEFCKRILNNLQQ